MSNSLETRVPFLDNDLVDFAMKVPVRLKLANIDANVRLNENEPGRKVEQYFEQTKDGKILLRKFLRRFVPDSVTQATKQGFSAPDASWFKGDSIDYVRRLLFNERAAIYQFLEPSAVRELMEEHMQGKQNRRLFIWSLLNVEHCLKNILSEGPSAMGSGLKNDHAAVRM